MQAVFGILQLFILIKIYSKEFRVERYNLFIMSSRACRGISPNRGQFLKKSQDCFLGTTHHLFATSRLIYFEMERFLGRFISSE